MKYSLSLILERCGLERTDYIDYENKKKKTYESISLWDPDEKLEDKKDVAYISCVDEFFSWDIKEIRKFRQDCALILADSRNQWDPQHMQYQNRLLEIKSDLVIMKNMSLIKCCNLMHEAFESLNRIVEIFSEAVIHHRDLQAIIELFYDYLGNPAYIVDSSFKVLAIDRRNNMRELSASWKRMEDNGYLQYDIITKLMRDNELSEMEAGDKAQWVSSAHFYTPFINYNLRRKKKLIGHLFIINMFRQITPGDIELSSILGSLIEKAMESDQKYQVERGRMYEYFLTDIMSGKMADREEIKKQMQSLSYPSRSYYIVAMLHSDERQLSEITEERVFQLLEQLRGCKPIHYENKIAALFPVRDTKEKKFIIEQISEIAENFFLKAGISETFYGYEQIHNCVQQALAALDLGDYRRERLSFFEKCAATYIQQNILSGKNMRILEPAGLKRLREYDEQNHTDYMRTLFVYLNHERNVIETAELLFIHRNTLTYRINKIEEITKINLNDPMLRLRILLTGVAEANIPTGYLTENQV